MKLKLSAFGNDELTLTWRDILLLVLGRTLKYSALIVKRGRHE